MPRKFAYVLDVQAPSVRRTTTYPTSRALAEDVRAYYHSLGWGREDGEWAMTAALRALTGDEPYMLYPPDGRSTIKLWRERL